MMEKAIWEEIGTIKERLKVLEEERASISGEAVLASARKDEFPGGPLVVALVPHENE